MIDLLCAAIISASDVDSINSKKFEQELMYHEAYINFQLETYYTELTPIVVFTADIPARFHDYIRKECAGKWAVSIEEVSGFENYKKYYKFTFSKI